MSREEAIKLIDNLKGMIDDTQGSDYDKAFNMAIEALEKQIQKKPLNNIEYPSCPSCNRAFYFGCIDKYCSECGQAIKWE